TLSVLVLRGDRFFLGHVGDTRIYHLRRGELAQLTRDHVWDRPDMQHVLKRAVGLDEHLVVDYADGELAPRDRFLLCSDGVWEARGQKRLHEVLQLHEAPQRAAEALVGAALEAGGADNATAVVARIDTLGAGGWLSVLDAGARLPVPPRLKPGQRLDDFDVL